MELGMTFTGWLRLIYYLETNKKYIYNSFEEMGLDFFSNKDILSSYFPSKSNHVISNVFFSMDRIAKEKKKKVKWMFYQ